MSISQQEKLDSLSEIFVQLTSHHQHQYAEMVQRIHSALQSGLEVPVQDVQDLQTITRYGLLQARQALSQIQEAIGEAERNTIVIDEIYSDALVQLVQREAEQILDDSES